MHPKLDEAEEVYFTKILASFESYYLMASELLKKHHKDFMKLDAQQRSLLRQHEAKLHAVNSCVMANQNFLSKMVQMHKESLGMQNEDSVYCYERKYFDSLRTTLRQLYREWSLEGKEERDQAFGPILAAAEDVRVLVPGAGLGRLVYEIAQLGFHAEGNEFSYFMLLCSEFILNHTTEIHEHTLFPFALQFTNNLSICHQLLPVRIPDVLPSTATSGTMSMAAGEFLEVYGSRGTGIFDCVSTCFFLDTAQNILEYIRVIYKILRNDGVWINLGPLMYHFEESEEISIELSMEEIVKLMEAEGFSIKEYREKIACFYDQNPYSMHKTLYECVYFAAVKSQVIFK